MRKLKILDYCWHIGHQADFYNALKDVADFYWIRQYKRPFSNQPRGELNVKNITHYEPGVYDAVILHLDQQCFEAKNISELGKGVLYKELNEVINDIPKIVVNHATPYWPEEYPSDLPDGCSQKLKDRMKKAVGNNIMVVNSYKAQKQWGFGETIVHGMNPNDWWDLPKERQVVTMISAGGLDMYYDRQFLESVKDLLWEEEEIKLCHITVDINFRNFDEYRNFIGRSLVYFNPTRESPMPRARTEAMLSGCCVITTGNQDASNFIEHGRNGFLTLRNPREAVNQIKWCFNNYEKAVAIGQAGKETAKKLFGVDRYKKEWMSVLSKALGKNITNNGIEN
jgi:hypothetical protein